ncbi:hypothetical protein EJB05_03093, partial [Eragrostis curvula]
CRGVGPRVTVEVACSPWPELHHQVLPARTVDQPEPESEPRPQFAPPSSEGAAMDGALAEIDIPGSHRLLLRVHCPRRASTELMANSTVSTCRDSCSPAAASRERRSSTMPWLRTEPPASRSTARARAEATSRWEEEGGRGRGAGATGVGAAEEGVDGERGMLGAAGEGVGGEQGMLRHRTMACCSAGRAGNGYASPSSK